MTVRMTDLVRLHSADNWLPNVNTERTVQPRHELALVRHIMREEACDIIPVVVASVWTDEPDTYGNNLFIEVRYAKRGWHATYAARVDHDQDPVTGITCYMS